MPDRSQPALEPVKIVDLRPTQMTVGMREVEQKRKDWKGKSDKERAQSFARHMVPVIIGPKDKPYLIDHHHLAMALHGEKVESVLVQVVADLSRLDKDAFWIFMDNKMWTHPYDENGERRDFDDIPKRVDELKDDPFRSLAGELRRIGGFAKDTTPFSEFLWADYLRRRIKRAALESDFSGALEKALTLAKDKDADFLPGWCGPSERGK